MNRPALAAVLYASLAAGQEDLPRRTAGEPLEFEPSLRLYDVPPVESGPVVEWETPIDEDRARIAAERAAAKAKRWQRLEKAGVVSKVEAERAVSQANRAVLRYQQARAATQRAQLEKLRTRAARGEASADLVAAAEAALRSTEALVRDAEALAQRTDLEFARNQLERQRRLQAAGLGSKSQVEKARAHLDQVEARVQPARSSKP
jgi:multidrug resistance efflux pump